MLDKTTKLSIVWSMQTLSIGLSYALAVVWGFKDVENRSWTTRTRGTIAVHASRTDDGKAFDKLPVFVDFRRTERSADGTYPDASKCKYLINDSQHHLSLRDEYRDFGYYQKQLAFLRWIINASDSEISTGSIIGTVDIMDIVRDSSSEWADAGANHYILSNPRRFVKPIIGVRGMPGFWQYPDDPILSREVIAC